MDALYYHCTQSKIKHGAKWLREEKITEQFEAIFKRLKIPEEALQKIATDLAGLEQEKRKFNTQHLDKLTKEKNTTTTMMDNLYLDKLKGKISDAQYDKFYQSLSKQVEDIDMRLSQLNEAEENYYATAQCIVNICNRAHEWFVGSEVNEKRQLINLVLSNLKIDDEKVLYNAQSPFNTILEMPDHLLWLGLVDMFLNKQIPFDISLQRIQTVFEELKLPKPLLLCG